MDKYKMIQQGIIKIYENNKKEKIVYARELYEALEIKKEFLVWIKKQIEKYKCLNSTDFTKVLSKNDNGNLQIEYIITIETAKEISIKESTIKSRKVKNYLVEAEKQLQETFKIPDELVETLKKAIEEIESQKNKISFVDRIETSKNSILINELSKLLQQNGYHIGQNKLFEKLRNEGYLIRQKGQNWNLPTQKAMELGLFEIKKIIINRPNGKTLIKVTPLVTGKGQIYFMKNLLGI